MAARKLKVIVTRKLPDPVETRMCELFDTELNVSDKPLTADELVDAMSRADVLVPTITDRIDSRLLSRSGDRLKLIANFGARGGQYRRRHRQRARHHRHQHARRADGRRHRRPDP
ncbi:hypothetical protein ACRAWD_17205 [Caulobacter segnis]